MLLLFSMEQHLLPVPVLWGQHWEWGPWFPLTWAQATLHACIVVNYSSHQLFTIGYLFSELCLSFPQLCFKFSKHPNIFANTLQIMLLTCTAEIL